MTALSMGRRTPMRAGDIVNHPLAASVTVHQGGIGCLDAVGHLVPGSSGVGLKCVGVIADSVSNTGGAAGAVTADVRRDGAWRFDNHGADTVTRAHIGGAAYIVDDQTLAATSGSNTRSAAGTIIDLDADGVWIVFK